MLTEIVDSFSLELLKIAYKNDKVRFEDIEAELNTTDVDRKQVRKSLSFLCGNKMVMSLMDFKTETMYYKILPSGRAVVENHDLQITNATQEKKRQKRKEIRECITLTIAILGFVLAVISLVWQGIIQGLLT